MKKIKLFMMALTLFVGGAEMFAQFDASKTYTIVNRNDASFYMQDNGTGGVALGGLNANSYWRLIPTTNDNCYYIQNTVTGKYIQALSSSSGVAATVDDSPVEYCILDCSANEGPGMYGIASTNNQHDFKSGTIGCNWHADNYVQSFAAVAGTNHRSFWKIVEAEEPITSFSSAKKYSLHNYAQDGYLKNDRDHSLKVQTTLTSNALWIFEASETPGRYYMKNALTGEYVQSTATKETYLQTGETYQEFIAKPDEAKGINIFAFASTNQDNLDFQYNDGDGAVEESQRTLGINWRTDSDIAQSFYAKLGGNSRSFWHVEEVTTADFVDNADQTSAIAAAAGSGKNAVVTRSMASEMWNTLVVPHAMNAQAISRNFGDGAKVAELKNESDGVLHFTSVDAIVAGTPYLVKPTIDVVNIITMGTTIATGLSTATGVGYDFVGIYAPTNISADDYFMAANNTLRHNDQGGSLKAFRAYFQQKGGSVKALKSFDIDGILTGVITPKGIVETPSTTIYNLAGQQLNTTSLKRNGIVIAGHKKIILQ